MTAVGPQVNSQEPVRVGADHDLRCMTHCDHLCQIISVFDPDGTGRDFAYTVGLADRGLPELHLWARPSEGEDPGFDWMLSDRDRHGVLLDFAEDLAAGRVSVGSTRTHVYDDGLATVVFRLDPTVDADEVEAYGARSARVIPIRWRLERPAAGRPAPVNGATAAEINARADVERWFATAIAARSGRMVYRCRPYGTRHDQPLGPQRAVVEAVAAQLRHSTAELITGIVFTMLAAGRGGWGDGYDRALLSAHARVAGRSAAYEEARTHADGVVRETLGSATAPTRLLTDALIFGCGDDDEPYREWFIDSVGRYARTTLGAEAVADVVPDDLYLSATTVRDVLYADREVRPLPAERLANPFVRLAVGQRIGPLSAADLRPCERAIAAMSRDDYAAWSGALLTATWLAARDQRALPGWDWLLHRYSAGSRLQRQRRTIERRFADGLDIGAQRRRYRALVDTLDGLATILTLPDNTDGELRDTLLAPVPVELLDRLGRLDLAALNARWDECRDSKAG